MRREVITGRVVAALAIAASITDCRAYDRDLYNLLVDGTSSDASDISADASVDSADVGPDVASDVAFDVGSDTAVDATLDATPDASDAPGDAPDESADVVDVPSDTPPSASSCLDAHATALFCDGFESPTFAHWTDMNVSMGSITRDTTIVYRGVASMRAQTTAPSGFAYLFSDALPAITSGDIYLRGYYYFASGYAIDGLTFQQAVEQSAPFSATGMQLSTGGGVSAYNGPGGQFIGGTSTIARDRWVCLEIHIVVSATAGVVELFMEGAPVGSMTGINTLPGSGYRSFGVGIDYTSNGQAAATVYSDEVIADTRRIGCDP